MNAWWAQTRAEVRMTIRRGETLLLTLGIPVGLLFFFSTTSVVGLPAGRRVDFIAPGILALSVLSTSLVALSIATGFERTYGVVRRLYVTPLGQRRLIASKIASVLITEALQVAVLATVAWAIGWQPHGSLVGLLATVAVLVLGSAGCAGIGLLLAGWLRAEVNLAASNGLYVLLLMVSGIVVPLRSLPHIVGIVVTWTPSGAMADGVRRMLSAGRMPSAGEWIALTVWALAAPLLAARSFRFD